MLLFSDALSGTLSLILALKFTVCEMVLSQHCRFVFTPVIKCEMFKVQDKGSNCFLPFTAQLFAIQLINGIIRIPVVIKFLGRFKF